MSKLLPPKVRRTLWEGLRSAFPDIGKLDSFLRISLNKERSNYVSDTATYPEQVEKVLQGAENEEWVDQLIEEALREQSRNQDLVNAKKLYEEYKAKSTIARAPEEYASWIRNKTGLEIPAAFWLSLAIVVLTIVGLTGWGLYNYLIFKPPTITEAVRQIKLEELANSIAQDLSTNNSVVNSKSWETDAIKATFDLTADSSPTFIARDYQFPTATVEFNIKGKFVEKKFEGDRVNIQGKIEKVEKLSPGTAKVTIHESEFIDLPPSM